MKSHLLSSPINSLPVLGYVGLTRYHATSSKAYPYETLDSLDNIDSALNIPDVKLNYIHIVIFVILPNPQVELAY